MSLYYDSLVLIEDSRLCSIYLAALREFFRASSDFSADGLTREIGLPQVEEQIKLDMQSMEENSKMKILTEESHRFPRDASIGSLNQMNDEDDEFFDVTDSEYDQTDKYWPFDQSLQSPVSFFWDLILFLWY